MKYGRVGGVMCVRELRPWLGRLTAVRHPDHRVRREGHILISLVVGLIALSVAFLPFVWLLPVPGAAFLSVALGLVLFMGIVLVLKRGHVVLGSLLILGAYLLVLAVGVGVSGRVANSPQFVVLAVTMAGAALGVRQVIFTLASALITLTLLYALDQEHGGGVVRVSDLIGYAALLCVLTAVVAAVTGSAVHRALAAEDRALARATLLATELRDTNQTLEDRVAVRTAELQRALSNQTELVSSLAELTVRDPLTGLHNRRHLDAEMVRMFEHSVRYERPLCLALLDLDSFKSINDRFGHEIGDEVLRRVAQILVEFTRGPDLVARYGGEELALVMPETALAVGVEVCERIRLRIMFEPWDDVAPGLTVTGSLGVCEQQGQDTVWHLLRSTDQLLYAAKAAGRNRVCVEQVRSG